LKILTLIETDDACRELYRSRDILVRDVTGHGSKTCVVTFDSFTDHRTLERPGFGEAFLRDRRIDAIHVLSRDNDWYQYAEMPDVIATIRQLTTRYDRVVAYGSSMGGYAAFRFAGLLEADSFIALSPQFTLDPAVVPFEQRWHEAAQRLSFIWDGHAPAPACVGYVFYDPHDDDRRHFSLMANTCRVIGVRLPYAGHPTGGYLAELGQLQDAVLQIVDDAFDPAVFERRARERRRDTPTYWMTLAHKTSRQRSKLKIDLAHRAVALAPGNLEYASQLADLLLNAQRFEEAGALHERIMSHGAPTPIILHRYSWYLTITERLDEAEAIAARLVADAPGIAGFAAQLATIRQKRQKHAELDATLRVAPQRNARSGLFGLAGGLSHSIFRAGALLRGKSPLAGRDPATIRKRLTTTPARPQFVAGWKRHLAHRKETAGSSAELVLIGDSLVEYWPATSFPQRQLNLGVAADRTQHVLWRLGTANLARLAPAHVVVMVGTNNLASGDDPAAIAAGITAIVRRLGDIWPSAQVLTIEIPPCGPEFRFNAHTRFLANRLLRASHDTLNIDQEMTGGFNPRSPNYHPDHIHFSQQGYDVLTRLVAGRLKPAVDRES
jgi:lysophospholipase L1-like esterase/pimeloyl-ACP methyl ester carboxylesterase